MDIYSELDRLKKLLDEGAITQEEFDREKARLLASNYAVQPGGWDLGIDEKSFVVLMHASQFLSSFIAPLIMWILFKDKSRMVDEAGKNILNFEMSFYIYSLVLCITCIGTVLVPFIAIAAVIFIIIAIIKAVNGETWPYPLTIRFLK
ncbi:MAG: DUF4870 domain-containing protein [Tannerella sp.]|jgi:uncharacterized Tic20 family protein|nr:DUF4870 domain-containing protein [Tannerella sp.]